LAHRYKDALIKAVKMYSNKLKKSVIVKAITEDLNLGYADTIYKLAKLIVKGAKFHGSDPRKIRVKSNKRLFIASRGFSAQNGNRNIRLLSTDKLKINIPRYGWIKCDTRFGERYLPLVKELVEKALNKEQSYTAKIIFRRGKIYLHLTVPIELYIKYFRKGEAKGNNIAGFDLNSDRINMVIIDRHGVIRDTKTEWYPEVNSHGYPSKKAMTLRLQALGRLLRYAYHCNVCTVVFEDLDRIKERNFMSNRNGHRKISWFPKRKLLEHGKVMALKYGFKVETVNPENTSVLGGKLSRILGLDIHTSSAYAVALRYLSEETFQRLLSLEI
jgi:IS605 OrfB family transposase